MQIYVIYFVFSLCNMEKLSYLHFLFIYLFFP